MNILAKRAGAVLLAAIGIIGLEARPTQAQIRQIPSAQQMFPNNPFWLVAPGVTQSQYLYNMRQYANTLQQFPPYVFGYNPYPPTIYQQNLVNPAYTNPYNYPVPPAYGYGYGYGY